MPSYFSSRPLRGSRTPTDDDKRAYGRTVKKVRENKEFFVTASLPSLYAAHRAAARQFELLTTPEQPARSLYDFRARTAARLCESAAVAAAARR